MFKKLKRCLAVIIASAAIATSTGCTIGDGTAYAMTIDGYQLRAGVFIFYQNECLEDAKDKAKEINPDINTDDEKALKGVKLTTDDGRELSFLDWVNEKTMEQCRQHVALIKMFEENNLELDSNTVKSIKEYAESQLEDKSDSNKYYINGIGEESLKEIYLNGYRSDMLFDALYGGKPEDELKTFYVENNVRTRYVALDLHDAEGNDLEGDGKKEVEDLADKLLSKVKGKSGKALLEAYDEIQDEYDKFVKSKTEEAVDGDSDGTDAPAENGTDSSTDSNADSDSSNASEDSSADSDTDTEGSDASEDSSADSDTDTDSSDDSEDSSADSDTDTDSSDDSEDSSADNDADTDSSDASEDNTADSDTDSSSADSTTGDEPVVTAAPEGSDSDTTTTTTTTAVTTSPYAMETAIARVTTDENTKEEELYYSPCKAVYDYLYDENTKYEQPEIKTDDEGKTIYIVTKLDINERLTDDDLWSEENIERVRSARYGKDFQKDVEDRANSMNVEKNDRAFKRYEVFGYKQPETASN